MNPLPRPGAYILAGACLSAASASPALSHSFRATTNGQCPTVAEELVLEREVSSMGTRLQVRLIAEERATGLAASEAAFEAVRVWEGRLSTWRGDSELTVANRAPIGEAGGLSAETFATLERVWPWVDRTGGAFNPAIGPLIDVWDTRGAGRIPNAEELRDAVRWSRLEHFELDTSLRDMVRRASEGWLDAGAFGKGVALEAAAEALVQSGAANALLNFGGQILAMGCAPDGEAWAVDIAHPRGRSRAVARLRLRNASVATTAQSERFNDIGGKRIGHVVDPRSGEPVPAWGSVSVVAKDPLIADVLSTALFVMGPDVAMLWVATSPEVGVLILQDEPGELRLRWNAAMTEWLEVGSERI